MSLINFIEQFPDEASCKQKFKEYREQVGVTCAKCGGELTLHLDKTKLIDLNSDRGEYGILWQLGVFASNISVMMCQKKDKFKRQEHRTFIDWFIAVPAKITRSGHQTELKIVNPFLKQTIRCEQIKMYKNHFYKADWQELDRLVDAA
jgi:hypothetical protein